VGSLMFQCFHRNCASPTVSPTGIDQKSNKQSDFYSYNTIRRDCCSLLFAFYSSNINEWLPKMAYDRLNFVLPLPARLQSMIHTFFLIRLSTCICLSKMTHDRHSPTTLIVVHVMAAQSKAKV